MTVWVLRIQRGVVRARRTAAARGLSSSRGEETGPRLCVDYLGQTLQVRESSPHEFTSSAGGNVGSPHKGHQGTLTPRFLPQNCCQVQVVGHHSRARARFSLSTEDGAASLLLSFSFSLFSRTPPKFQRRGSKTSGFPSEPSARPPPGPPLPPWPPCRPRPYVKWDGPSQRRAQVSFCGNDCPCRGAANLRNGEFQTGNRGACVTDTCCVWGAVDSASLIRCRASLPLSL